MGKLDEAVDSDGINDDSSTCSEEYDRLCARCGKGFLMPTIEEDYDGDRCDMCGSPHHPDCQQICHDLRGESSLCVYCVGERQQDPQSIVGDFRIAPISFWQKLYSPFFLRGNVQVAGTSRPCEEPSEGSGNVFQPLDHFLDYIMRFLDGEHSKSTNLPEQARSKILQKVKVALAWKAQSRLPHEVNAKLAELNFIMSGTVRHL